MKDSESAIRAQVHQHMHESRVKAVGQLVTDQAGLNKSLAGLAQQTDQGRRDFGKNRLESDGAVRREIEKSRRESAATQRQVDQGRGETLERVKKPERP
jgi:hypothetical protein